MNDREMSSSAEEEWGNEVYLSLPPSLPPGRSARLSPHVRFIKGRSLGTRPPSLPPSPPLPSPSPPSLPPSLSLSLSLPPLSPSPSPSPSPPPPSPSPPPPPRPPSPSPSPSLCSLSHREERLCLSTVTRQQGCAR